MEILLKCNIIFCNISYRILARNILLLIHKEQLKSIKKIKRATWQKENINERNN